MSFRTHHLSGFRALHILLFVVAGGLLLAFGHALWTAWDSASWPGVEARVLDQGAAAQLRKGTASDTTFVFEWNGREQVGWDPGHRLQAQAGDEAYVRVNPSRPQQVAVVSGWSRISDRTWWLFYLGFGMAAVAYWDAKLRGRSVDSGS